MEKETKNDFFGKVVVIFLGNYVSTNEDNTGISYQCPLAKLECKKLAKPMFIYYYNYSVG